MPSHFFGIFRYNLLCKFQKWWKLTNRSHQLMDGTRDGNTAFTNMKNEGLENVTRPCWLADGDCGYCHSIRHRNRVAGTWEIAANSITDIKSIASVITYNAVQALRFNSIRKVPTCGQVHPYPSVRLGQTPCSVLHPCRQTDCIRVAARAI
jgi:hypothetical protein